MPPFVMSGWTIRGYPNQHYQGWMEKDGQVRQADQRIVHVGQVADQIAW
jgi:hypothetical protein